MTCLERTWVDLRQVVHERYAHLPTASLVAQPTPGLFTVTNISGPILK